MVLISLAEARSQLLDAKKLISTGSSPARTKARKKQPVLLRLEIGRKSGWPSMSWLNQLVT